MTRLNRFVGIILLFAVMSFSPSQVSETYELKIEIMGWEENEGHMIVAIFNNPEDYLKNDFKHVVVKKFDRKCIAVFKDIPPGTYAASVFHDKNMNGEMDSNMFGFPKESYGFSNNVMGSFGPPDFKKASFKIEDHQAISIELR